MSQRQLLIRPVRARRLGRTAARTLVWATRASRTARRVGTEEADRPLRPVRAPQPVTAAGLRGSRPYSVLARAFGSPPAPPHAPSLGDERCTHGRAHDPSDSTPLRVAPRLRRRQFGYEGGDISTIRPNIATR